MKTLQQVLDAIIAKDKGVPAAFDGREIVRLSQFLTSEQCESVGLKFQDEERKVNHDAEVVEFTEANIVSQLKQDVSFGFQKALDKRGLSAACMYSVVLFWMWVLEPEFYDEIATPSDENYAQYGLPLFKKVAIEYGFPNVIGSDTGAEQKYASE